MNEENYSINWQNSHGNPPGYPDYEDSCQVKYCENEVVVDDFGFVLCYEHSMLPEYDRAIRRAADKEEWKEPHI